jgi:hypothetical protein
MKPGSDAYDRGAIGVSLLCMVHCLAMPLLALTFPLGIFATLAHNHWHWLFLAAAAPVSLLAVWRTDATHRDGRVVAGVIFGLCMLAVGIYVNGHNQQIILTLTGATSLFLAHLANLRNNLRRGTANH